MITKQIEQYDATDKDFATNKRIYTICVYQEFPNARKFGGNPIVLGLKYAEVTWDGCAPVKANLIDDDNVDVFLGPDSDEPTRLTRI